ncbi:MAG TPA: hypothetical protein VND93_11810 [Myxococcales bacterium]|nr:hypothetical protein [Myxococcales bacterium]
MPARKKRYSAAKLVREAAPRPDVEPARLVRVWRRVLERRLCRRLRSRVHVQLHDNTHTMITYLRSGGGWRMRLHHMFLAAPDEVLGALARYVGSGDADASARLDRFIERNRVFIRRVTPAQLRRRLRIDPRGDHHDLEDIFGRLNRRYFGDRVSATITYGPAPRARGPRKSIKMGSYSAETRVIRIHPALDQAQVPSFFVEWIVFHEMLHHVHRARRGEDGRRCVHTPEFLEHERSFHDYHRAQRWEDENLDLLLRSRPG